MTKAILQRRIWTYRKRRKDLRDKVKNLTKKISLWEARSKRIEKVSEKLSKIVKAVNLYFQVDIRKKCTKPEYNLARNIYYKIAIESKIEGKSASEFIKRRKKRASDGRLYLTRGFKNNSENKDAYHRFKKYFETK